MLKHIQNFIHATLAGLTVIALCCGNAAHADVPLPWEQASQPTAARQVNPDNWPYQQTAPQQATGTVSPQRSASVVTANYQASESERQQVTPVAEPEPFPEIDSPLTRQLRRPESLDADLEAIESEASGKPGSLSSLLWTLGVVVVLSFGFIFGVQWYVKRQPGGGRSLPNEALELLGRRSVDARHAVQMIRCGSRILIVGLSADGMRTLAEINDPVEVDALAAICKAGMISGNAESLFQQVFQRQWSRSSTDDVHTSVEPRLAEQTTEPHESRSGISRQQAVELSAELEKRLRQQQGNRYA